MIYASAPGKVNLFFEVGPIRADGFHSVLSLYQSLTIRQRVGVATAQQWSVSTTGNLPQAQLDLVPSDEENLIVVAAKALADFVGIQNPQPMHFETVKEVPVAAGLAGGSADAAAALIALNEAWCLGLSFDQLMEVGSRVGSDVPFALLGGTAIGVDTGIELTPLTPIPTLHVVLLVSPYGLSTGKVFGKFDELYPQGDLNLSPEQLLAEIADGRLTIGKNSLLPAAVDLKPELRELINSTDLPLMLSGSGPTLAFVTANAGQAAKAAEQLRSLGHFLIETTSDVRGAELG
jgi:4-diphosphocytidyl-2-C-methyl-D-erythritol kinase